MLQLHGHQARQISRSTWFSCFLLALACLGSGMTFMTKLSAATETIHSSPPVYLFIVHGFDPCDAARLHELRAVGERLGYDEAHVYQCYQGHALQKHILTVKQTVPEARLVLTGFSLGTLTIRTAAQHLHESHGIDVDALIYLGGWFLPDSCTTQPAYVGTITHVLGQYFDAPFGHSLSRADNFVYKGTCHFGVAMHPATIRQLEMALMRMKGQTQNGSKDMPNVIQPVRMDGITPIVSLGKPLASEYIRIRLNDSE